MEKPLINDFVDISIRIKPQIEQETTSSCIEVLNKNPAVLLVLDKLQTYHFDNIFDNETNQEHIYNETVKPLLDKVKTGYNCTVFSYGQTGTGKTYTMGTNPDVFDDEDTKGLIPRALEDLFSWEDADTEISVSVSFIEIYNEKVFDLLANERKMPLCIKGFNVQGFKKESVYNSYDAKKVLRMGILNRHIAETKLNPSSSRSHAIFTIYCNIRNCDSEFEAKLNLVDLAGSESARKTGNQGNTFQEGININKGLLSLGLVMTALTNNFNHIPYRQSIITTILQDSLNKRNYISLIACVSSSLEDANETLGTLEFANRVKKMRNKPEVSQIVSKFERDNPALFVNQSKVSNTPQIRRGISGSFRTPLKKPRNVLTCPVMASVAEQESNSTTDSPKSLFSLSVSSVSNDAFKQISFSPIIKKCLTAMESTIINNLESAITRTLKREEGTRKRIVEVKENNTPTSLLTDRIKNEISKLVRMEIAEFTGSVSTRAASSPIERSETRISVPKRALNFDDDNASPINNNSNNNNGLLKELPEMLPKKDSQNSGNDNTSPINTNTKTDDLLPELPVFKVPEVPAKKKRKVANTPSEPQRKSLRLQLNNSINHKSVINNDCVGISTNIKSRRSTRISVITKKNNKENLKNKLDLSTTNSPITVHSKQVLNVLNTGKVKDLEKLQGIGIKTAEKILLYRQINGQFKKISDLALLPRWSTCKYKHFVSENFLKDV